MIDLKKEKNNGSRIYLGVLESSRSNSALECLLQVKIGGLGVSADSVVGQDILEDGLARRSTALLEGLDGSNDHLEVGWVSRWSALGSGLLGLGRLGGLWCSWGLLLLGGSSFLGSRGLGGLLGSLGWLSWCISSGSGSSSGLSGDFSDFSFFGHFGFERECVWRERERYRFDCVNDSESV